MPDFKPYETVSFRFRGVVVATYDADSKHLQFGPEAYITKFLPEDMLDFGLWCMYAGTHAAGGRRPENFVNVELN